MELTKGSVYAVRADGAELIFDSVDADGYPYGYLRQTNGRTSTVGLFDKWQKVGTWTVVDAFTKHMSGQHDQSSHGNWAHGTFELTKVVGRYDCYEHPSGSKFYVPRFDDSGLQNIKYAKDIVARKNEAIGYMNELLSKYPMHDVSFIIDLENRVGVGGETVTSIGSQGNARRKYRASQFNEEKLFAPTADEITSLFEKWIPDVNWHDTPKGSVIVLNPAVFSRLGSGTAKTWKEVIHDEFVSTSSFSGNEYVGNDYNGLQATIIHEFGHAVDQRYYFQATADFEQLSSSPIVSKYGKTNHREFFAEMFTAWELDKDNPNYKKIFYHLDFANLAKNLMNKSIAGFHVIESIDSNVPPIVIEFGGLQKHLAGQHDQSTHGSWANHEWSKKFKPIAGWKPVDDKSLPWAFETTIHDVRIVANFNSYWQSLKGTSSSDPSQNTKYTPEIQKQVETVLFQLNKLGQHAPLPKNTVVRMFFGDEALLNADTASGNPVPEGVKGLHLGGWDKVAEKMGVQIYVASTGFFDKPNKRKFGRFTQSYQNVNHQGQYWLAHEWGHARQMQINQINNDASSASTQSLWNRAVDGKLGLSKYGQTNSKEGFAEAFADWFLSEGKSGNQATQTYAYDCQWSFDRQSEYGQNPVLKSKTDEDNTVYTVEDICDFGEGLDKPVAKTIFVVPPLNLIKHLAGQHDQSSHGNWANGGPVAEGKYGQWGAERQQMILSMKDKGPSVAWLTWIQGLSDASVEIADRARAWADTKGNAYWRQELQNYLDARDVQHQGDSLLTEQLTDDFYQRHAGRILLDAGDDIATRIKPGLKEIYNMNYEYTDKTGHDDTIKSRILNVEVDLNDGLIKVEGSLFNQLDDQIGEFERTLNTSTGVVSHDVLQIWESQYQNTGFGNAFINQSENYYISHGFNAITLDTAWNGAYTWAKMGYDWSGSHPEDWRNVRKDLTDRLFVIPNEPKNKPVRDDIETMITRLNGDSLASDFPTPYDVAMVGYGDGTDGQGNALTMWLGKSILSNQRYHYKKKLNVAPRQIISKGIYDE